MQREKKRLPLHRSVHHYEVEVERILSSFVPWETPPRGATLAPCAHAVALCASVVYYTLVYPCASTSSTSATHSFLSARLVFLSRGAAALLKSECSLETDE